MTKGQILCATARLMLVFAIVSSIPLRLKAQTERGIDLYNSWEYGEAEKALREALKSDPNDVRARYYLGLAIMLQEKYSEALDILLQLDNDLVKSKLKRQSTLLPDEYQLQIALARAHLGLKHYREAWKNLEAAKKQNSAASDVYVYRGAYYLQLEKPKQAIKELEKAIKIDADNAYAYYYAGHAYLRTGNPARAVDMFKTFVQLAPYAPEVPKVNALIAALC